MAFINSDVVRAAIDLVIDQLSNPHICDITAPDVEKLDDLHRLTSHTNVAILRRLRIKQGFKGEIMEKLYPLINRGVTVEEIIELLTKE